MVVTNVDQYLVPGFIAGLGFADEPGASIILTSELLPKEKRGITADVFATSGVTGTITACFVHYFPGYYWYWPYSFPPFFLQMEELMHKICSCYAWGWGLVQAPVVSITMSAEQFGTNLRATVATSIPKMVTGFLPLVLLLVKFLES